MLLISTSFSRLIPEIKEAYEFQMNSTNYRACSIARENFAKILRKYGIDAIFAASIPIF
jgi:hypothetical protein